MKKEMKDELQLCKNYHFYCCTYYYLGHFHHIHCINPNLKGQIISALLHITTYSNVIDAVFTLNRMHSVVSTIEWFRLDLFDKLLHLLLQFLLSSIILHNKGPPSIRRMAQTYLFA